MNKELLSRADVEVRYANWLKQVVDMIAPKNLYLYLGRASGKTTDIIAERSMEIVYDMPGAQIALVSDTYKNAMNNIVPSIMEGWERKGWIKGIHFVHDVRPPADWAKPYKPVVQYKHTLSTWNGVVFKLVSMDRPSTGAGDSYQHLIGDEAKFLKKKKISKLIPAIRGEYVRFHHSPYYRGHTFTSDMANPANSIQDDDWMHEMAKQMDKEQIKLILRTAMIINEIKIELLEAQKKGDKVLIARGEKTLARWMDRYNRIRKNSTFFYIASSLVNADVLTKEYFNDQLSALGFTEYCVSVLSIKPRLEKGARFYVNLSEKHFYSDGYDYNYFDQFNLGRQILDSSLGLRYINHDEILEGGFDAGNMMSLVIGQEQGNKMRVLKNLYTLTPEWIDQLGEKFRNYFSAHKKKILHLYYDRSANQYQKAGKDFANELKDAIEKKEGIYTGWTVNLMSRNQGNVTHAQEYDLMLKLLSNTWRQLPTLLIDQHECRELKSSLEIAPVEIKQIADKKIIRKIKTSEQLPLERLPMESTNFSDAFKALICRQKWLKIASKHAINTFSDPQKH